MHSPRELKLLLVLFSAFILGLVCCQFFSFTVSANNYIFVGAVLFLPLIAIWPVLRLSKWQRRFGCLAIAVVLALACIFVLFQAMRGFPEVSHNGCIRELSSIHSQTYSVRLYFNCGGGATSSFSVQIEQQRLVWPGLMLTRRVDWVDGAYEGSLSSPAPDTIRLQIPKGVFGSGWDQSLDRIYHLKPWVYF